MSLAMRFLSTEFTKPKSNAFGNAYGQKPFKKQVGSQSYQSANGRSVRQVCWQFNSGGCTFETCRYPHVCSRCFMVGHSQHSCKVNVGTTHYTNQPIA